MGSAHSYYSKGLGGASPSIIGLAHKMIGGGSPIPKNSSP
jgi:hypothetical protein